MASLTSLQERFDIFHAEKMDEGLPTQFKKGRIEGIFKSALVDYRDFFQDTNNIEEEIEEEIITKEEELQNLRNIADGNIKLSDGSTALDKKNGIREQFSEAIAEADKKVSDLVLEVEESKQAYKDYLAQTFGPNYRMARTSKWTTNITFIVAELIIMGFILGLEVGLNESLFYGLGVDVSRAMFYAISMSVVLAFVNFVAGSLLAWSMKHPLKRYKNYRYGAVAIILSIVVFTYFFTEYRDTILSELNDAQTGGSFVTMFMLATIAYVAAAAPPFIFLNGVPFWEKKHVKELTNDITHFETKLVTARKEVSTVKGQEKTEIKLVDDEVATLGTNTVQNASDVERLQKELEELRNNLNEAKTGKTALITTIQSGWAVFVKKVLDHYRSNAGNPDFDQPASQTWMLS